jgi:hypothetical protein
MTSREIHITSRKEPRIIVPVMPRAVFELEEKSMMNGLHGEGLKKCEGIHRGTDMKITRNMYTYSLATENISYYPLVMRKLCLYVQYYR